MPLPAKAFQLWLHDVAPAASTADICRISGIKRTTLAQQLVRGKVAETTLVNISRALQRNPLAGAGLVRELRGTRRELPAADRGGTGQPDCHHGPAARGHRPFGSVPGRPGRRRARGSPAPELSPAPHATSVRNWVDAIDDGELRHRVSAATGVAPQNYSAQLTANRLSPELAVATAREAGVGFTGGLVATGLVTEAEAGWPPGARRQALDALSDGELTRSCRRAAAGPGQGAAPPGTRTSTNRKDLGEPRMIAILQWTTLAVCGIVALARIPSALRGENRSLFFLFLLMTLATLLSIAAPYEAFDHVLGGTNIANLVLRFLIFAAVSVLGFRVARGFGAKDALRLITGPIGIGVLGFSSLAVAVVFLMMDTAGSSAGLVEVAAKDARNAALVEFYGAAGRLYPAYVTLALLPAMVRAVRSSLPVLVRCSAGLLAFGAIAITLSLLSPVIPAELGFVRFLINYTAILCLVLGLALIWLGSIIAKRKNRRKSAAAEISRNVHSQNH